MTASNSPGSIKADLRNAIVDLTGKQFDQLILFLLKELDEQAMIEFVPETSSVDLDFSAARPHPIVPINYGIKHKQVTATETVSVDLVRQVAASIEEQSYETGAVITTGSFSSQAQKTAQRLDVELIDGGELADLLIEEKLGFTENGSELVLDEDFWDLFRGQTRSDTVPSIEIPQADSIDRLTQTLTAVAAGNHHKDDIAAEVESITGDSFEPRQADYYGTAGWLLGFLHKERQANGATGRGRWGITRLGRTYLSLRKNGEDETAARLLQNQIRGIEVIRRILNTLQETKVMKRDAVEELVNEETELGGTTVPRRTLTIIQWFKQLPEVEVTGRGSSQELRYASDSTASSDIEKEISAKLGSSTDEAEITVVDSEDEPTDENKVMDKIMASFEPLSETD